MSRESVNCRPVIDDAGNEYPSLKAAAAALGVGVGTICNWINCGKTPNGKALRYLDGKFAGERITTRHIRCKETQQVFRSQLAAANALKVSRSMLSEHLNGQRPDVRGYHFEKYEG